MNPPLSNTNPDSHPPPPPVSISSLAAQLAAQPRTSSAVSPSKRPSDDADRLAERDSRQCKNSSTPGTEQPGALLAPFTPAKRVTTPSRLSLQMPSRGPLSPVLDPALGYSVARRPRLDYSRACTSLHHSTLAESSPDSSPLASGAFAIPSRAHQNRTLDSPMATAPPGSSHASSLGSQCMLDYAPSVDDSDTSSDDELDDTDIDEALAVSLSSTSTTLATKWTESAAAISLRNHQKARQGTKAWRRHHHSGGILGRNPGPSPTLRPGQRGMMANLSERERRGSLDLGPAALDAREFEVVRRPVSRRGSLLPKTKNFQRIKAALIEETCPVDVEVKREAEITRQIREEDEPVSSSQYSQTRASSISASAAGDIDLSDVNEESSASSSDAGKRATTPHHHHRRSFQEEAQRHGGFWFSDQMDGISPAPAGIAMIGAMFPMSQQQPSQQPPQPQRQLSDGDIVMSTDSTLPSPTTASASIASSTAAAAPSGIRKNKRRRTQDELFETSIFKRRAVSPSVCGSPIMAQSPPVNNGGRGRLSFQGLADTNDSLMNMSLQ